MFTIIDIETTGNGIKGNKITEIAIFKFDGDKIVDEFTSLVNPECEIPYFITGLTGIDNHMVRKAPTFKEIAPKIKKFTEEAIFVAHSVNFDYNVIKEEFKCLGQTFSRKKLCTVRLSRRLFPGFYSYSLGKLCSSLNIPLTNRHRARGDAHATVLLFQKLLKAENSETIINTFLNARSQEATLPPSLSKLVYDRLPDKTGIYYFKNKKGTIIYVGKAKSIKKRVLSHFYDKADKEIRMCRETETIDFEVSGNELIALLMESAAIKHHFPLYNRAQKKHIPSYCIFSYVDRNGIMHLGFNKVKAVPRPLVTFYNTTDCRLYLEQLCKDYELCPKYCHLQEGVAGCSHFRITHCGGICRGKEPVIVYNSKVQAAIEAMTITNRDLIIKEKGRNEEEDAIVLLRDGLYSGYGYIPKDVSIQSLEDVMAFTTLQNNTMETQRMLQSYMVKYPKSVVDVSLS